MKYDEAVAGTGKGIIVGAFPAPRMDFHAVCLLWDLCWYICSSLHVSSSHDPDSQQAITSLLV